jgi:choline dehydrogenase-like flavoprotein
VEHGKDYDVVIVGAGFAGAILAAELAELAPHCRVLVLEAGPDVGDAGPASAERAGRVRDFVTASVRTPDSPYRDHREAPRPAVVNDTYYDQKGPDHFLSNYERRVGGTSWHWLGTSLRMLPSDFRLQTLYWRGVDWPITYSDLEPWYCKAERELGVAGDGAAWDGFLGAYRSADYPMPPIWPTYLDGRFQEAVEGAEFDGLPLRVTPTPQARNSQAYGGRPACAGNTSCIPVCPIQAKYDATVHIQRARKSKNAVIQARSVAYQVTVDQHQLVKSVLYRDWHGENHEVTARVFVLAAHAIETPKLMLMSAGELIPNGLSNSSDQVGRNLMDHNVKLSYALAGEPVYPFRGPLSTSGVESLRDGPFRAARAAFRVEIGNDGWSWPTTSPFRDVSELTGAGLFGAALRDELEHRVTRQVRLASLVEVLPQAENRVLLSETKRDALGLPHPAIQYRVDDYTQAGFAAARNAHDLIFQRLRATEIHHDTFLPYFGAGHIMGTCRMGDDPHTSVVNRDLQSHDHRNLYIVGSSVFPTGATNNPTLTIAALAVRAAPVILRELRPRVTAPARPPHVPHRRHYPRTR